MYISTKEFAAIARLHPKSAARICRQAHEEGLTWLGHRLDVRMTRAGRGGRGGKAYEVSIASLPEFYRHALAPRPVASEPPYLSEPDEGQSAPRPVLARDLKQHDWRSRSIGDRYRTIKPVLRTQPGSRLRRERVHDAAIERGVSPKTIYRWIHAYELHGLAGLAPQVRPPRSPVVVSRRFDKAFVDKFGRDALLQVGEKLESLVKGMWASSQSENGAAAIARDAATLLQLFCEKRSWHDDEFIYEPSRAQVVKFRRYRYLWLAQSNAYDLRDVQPRIKRDYSAVEPMECVFADVKYLDTAITFEGKRRRPILIAFLDAGTGRIFGHLTLGRTNPPAATANQAKQAFAAMTCDPLWGVPKTLYVDNGNENKGFDEALSELGALAPHCRIIRARAHNPQAKAIEGMFAVLNRHISSNMPGFTGGKPGKRRAKLGQRHATPFTGSWREFVAEYRLRLEDYGRKPRRGEPSPDQVFAEKIKGKELNVLDADHVMAILTGVVVRRPVRQGRVIIKGEHYFSPVLTTRSGERILVHSRHAAAVGGASQGSYRADDVQDAIAADQANQEEMRTYYFEDEDGNVHDLEKVENFGPTDPRGRKVSRDRINHLWAQIAGYEEELAGKGPISTMFAAVTRAYFHCRSGGAESKSGISSEIGGQPDGRRRIRLDERARLNDHIRAIGDTKPDGDERHAPEYHLQQMLENAEQHKKRYICSIPSEMGMDKVITRFVAAAPDTRYHAHLKKGNKTRIILQGIRSRYTDLIAELSFGNVRAPEVIVLTEVNVLPKSEISELVSELTPMLDRHKIGLLLLGNDDLGLPENRVGNTKPSPKISKSILEHFDFFKFSFDQFSDQEITKMAMEHKASANVAKFIQLLIADGSIAGGLANIQRAVKRLSSAEKAGKLSLAEAKVLVKRS